jgi:hypothetical protein
MAFNTQDGPSSHSFSQSSQPPRVDPSSQSTQFDILDWYPQFQSCHKYFLDHAQYSPPVQALAAFLNIQLPFQKQQYPVTSPSSAGGDMHLRQPNPFSQSQNAAHTQGISLIPYIRRLVATGHDTPAVLHGFFGEDWVGGVGSLHEIERRNYMFAAKSTSWMKVKQAYDMSPEETVPFIRPLQDASEKEILAAEAGWSEWLAMQDWMLGPRAPANMKRNPRMKREEE